MHRLLARVQKIFKRSNLLAVGWKLKIGPGFGNPWGPIFLAQNNFFMHRLFVSVQENNKF